MKAGSANHRELMSLSYTSALLCGQGCCSSTVYTILARAEEKQVFCFNWWNLLPNSFSERRVILCLHMFSYSFMHPHVLMVVLTCGCQRTALAIVPKTPPPSALRQDLSLVWNSPVGQTGWIAIPRDLPVSCFSAQRS